MCTCVCVCLSLSLLTSLSPSLLTSLCPPTGRIEEVWELNEEQCIAAARELLDADRVIHEQQVRPHARTKGGGVVCLFLA